MSSQHNQRVLVTGGSGLLGRTLIKELIANGYEVLGLAFSRVSNGLIKCDLNDGSAVEQVFDKFKPALVVHAAAQRAPDQFDSDRDASFKLNVDASRSLAEQCTSRSIDLIHISTDYVFDGKSPPYSENDLVSPVNAYGLSKADAEAAVAKASNGNAVILRVPVMYGDETKLGESAVSALMATLLDKSGQQRKVSSYELRRPSSTEDISCIITQLVSKKLASPGDIRGVYQWSGKEELTKYDMVKIMAEVFNLPMDHIVEDATEGSGPVARPRDVTMSTTRLEQLGISRHTPFADSVRRLFSKFVNQQV